MSWLFLGVVYSTGFAIVGWLLRDQAGLLSWFRAVALLVPPLTGAVVIVARPGADASGCSGRRLRSDWRCRRSA